MATRAQINAIFPAASDAVFRETGVYPDGVGITAKDGSLALSVTLLEWPAADLPESILGVPAVFQVVERPVFLGRPPRRGRAAS